MDSSGGSPTSSSQVANRLPIGACQSLDFHPVCGHSLRGQPVGKLLPAGRPVSRDGYGPGAIGHLAATLHCVAAAAVADDDDEQTTAAGLTVQSSDLR